MECIIAAAEAMYLETANWLKNQSISKLYVKKVLNKPQSNKFEILK